MTETYLDRRRLLQVSGAAIATAIAGCSGQDGEGGGTPTEDETPIGDGEPTPTETETTTVGEETMTEGETTTAAGEETTTTGGGGSGTQAIDDYLTSDPAASNYDGSVVDKTGQDEVTVKVGTQGNDGNFAFSPVAIRISSGTAIKWEWTGEGGQHNVVSDENSDFDFTSGDPVTTGTFTQSFDETGAGLYFCEPHRSLGMKGAFEVVE